MLSLKIYTGLVTNNFIVDTSSTELIERSSQKNFRSNSKVQPMGTSPFAMENRDPNNLNAHCQVKFIVTEFVVQYFFICSIKIYCLYIG